MTKLPNCPICRKSAKVIDTKLKGDMRYYIRCGCLAVQLHGHNIPDLEASWKRWIELIKQTEKQAYIKGSNDCHRAMKGVT